MRQIGDVVIGLQEWKPYISVPDPWYGRLRTFRKILIVIDAILTLGGVIAAALGLPFGFPLIGAAIFLLLLIAVGRHVIVVAEVATATAEPLTATGETEPQNDVED